ncbi:hypothetical protein [Deinococcus ficus]|uniref:hypothetical protein n=1 Tax=Deinococcus ficus TaxID=317577 RepID=UPI0003B363FB|nr:hypothetical protein [Deinococcus ficus]
MSHRLHAALISFRQVHFTSDKWGAVDLARLLASGPIAFRAWFDRDVQVNPDAVRALGVVPEAFAVVNFDDQALKISWHAGLAHQAEAAQALGPDSEEFADQLTRLTPHILHSFRRLLQERWPGWTVNYADSPMPQRDWVHLPGQTAEQVWQAFRTLPPPRLQGNAKDRYLPALQALLGDGPAPG